MNAAWEGERRTGELPCADPGTASRQRLAAEREKEYPRPVPEFGGGGTVSARERTGTAERVKRLMPLAAALLGAFALFAAELGLQAAPPAETAAPASAAQAASEADVPGETLPPEESAFPETEETGLKH